MGLIHTEGRVIVRVDLESKNQWTFDSGITITLAREYNNFNLREVKPVNATVVSAENIPIGSQILIHHNATHDTNKIFDYEEETVDIKYFSIPEKDCYAWLDEYGNPHPIKNHAFGLRVFEPYTGALTGMEPKVLKDILYITSDCELNGKVVLCLKASDYEIVYQHPKLNREARVIRLRHSEDAEFDREEIIGIHHELTEKVNNGQLLVGLSISDAKPLIHHEIKSSINTTNITS